MVGEDWKEYINKTCLEVTCGEAPFLTSRYDTTTGQMIAVPDRIGLLDRKLNVLAEQFHDYDMWMCWAINAYASTYGYEWQGDNLLLARCNLFLTLIENLGIGLMLKARNWLHAHFLDCIADTISWNVWQMDGLKRPYPARTFRANQRLESQQRNLVQGCWGGRAMKSLHILTAVQNRLERR